MSEIYIDVDSDSDDNSDYDLNPNDGAGDSIEAGGVVYSTTLFSQNARRRNIVSEKNWVTVTSATKREAFFVSFGEDIRKAHYLRRERG